ncbi:MULTISPECIES: PEGA domain-containing protein [Myxococcaceae]|uniref:PEGA domain-containing protein n=1 Tax=Myxococcaceae TaxID=31 RepID=UPI00188EFA0C|nr:MULTISPECIES: PEGA domain-containing protein [Myxococcaceae]MBF5044284.1 PEGA domain-containing protein [Simulacricoccus sp. 17bor-14]
MTVLLPLQAFAQAPRAPASAGADDDGLLAPLTPAKKPARAAAPHPKAAPAPAAPAAEDDDELIAPLVTRPTFLRVRLPAGLKGARLLVDGDDAGALPGAEVSVRPGTHHVLVRRPGYRDFSTRVRTPEGKTTEVGAQLVAVAGVLAVGADVPGARVRIDGKAAGTAPLADVVLTPGAHEVVVSREGYFEERSRLSVKAGRDYRVDAQLRPDGSLPVAASDRPEAAAAGGAIALAPRALPQEPAAGALAPTPSLAAPAPWFKRWYVWAGVGAVATAAVVGTVAATHGGGTAQPFTPGEVCGGNCDAVLHAQPARR